MKRLQVWSGIICATICILMNTTLLAADAPSVPSCVPDVDCATGSFGLSQEEIALYPKPNVRQAAADTRLMYDRQYRRVNGAITMYDAPNGNPVRTMASGFNFVTITQDVDGWAQIRSDRWVPSAQLTNDVPISSFAGIFLPEEPLPYTAAWLLVNMRPSRYPGGSPSNDNPLLYRYTLVSLYATVEVDGWRWYQIGVDQWVKQTQVAKVLPVERFDDIDTERWISIDLYEQVFIAYEGDKPVYASLVASGLPQWATNEGLFHVYIRYTRTLMSGAEGRPDFYYLEEVPWTMYFDNDIALHGAYWHDGFGYRRSHGCVNLSITDAYWLYQWASAEFDTAIPNDTGPAVFVYSSDTYR